MRARICVTLLLSVVVLSTLAESAPTRWQAEHSRYANHLACPQQWWTGTTATRSLVACEARLFGVSVPRALGTACRESRFDPRAYNRSSSAEGLFQHIARYWGSRLARWVPRGGWHTSAFGARTNAVVTMFMVASGGWGPWAGGTTWCPA